MSGSRLGRGRGGRLAVYVGCGVVVVLLVFLYRAATSEMARLRELHVQCAHQQEALAAQLQVIFEYKVRLEKSLAEEKSSNAAVKQELQQRASREKSLRDKDGIEATQRFNSLQQTYKLLQTEHQDLQEECKKRDKQALEDKNRLESTLKDLRSRVMQADEDKRSLEHFKSKYLELQTNNTKLEDQYNNLVKSVSDKDSTIEHLRKETFQLRRDLEKAKDACKVDPLSQPSLPPQPAKDKTIERIPSNMPYQQNRPSQQQQQQSTASPSSKAAVRSESSTKPSNNLGSTSADKVLPQTKPVSKRLPAGVVPIPPMIVHKIENHDAEEKDTKKKEDHEQNSQQKSKAGDVDGKEKKQIADIGNLNPPFAGARHVGEILGRRDNSWFRVEPGVQEIGEELNHLDRFHGLDDGVDRQGADPGDDQYEGVDYEKDQQKNNDIHLVEGEDEGEDEDDQDYPHNLKQDKHE